MLYDVLVEPYFFEIRLDLCSVKVCDLFFIAGAASVRSLNEFVTLVPPCQRYRTVHVGAHESLDRHIVDGAVYFCHAKSWDCPKLFL